MSKIAIVGVEGSGKTVLMTVLGEKFQTPDSYGLFLSPETRETSDFHRVNLDKLEHGEWPIETPHDSVRSLRWTLQRKDANDENTVMADLNFLDFAGEIYREAFDGDADAKDRQWAEECEILRNYVREADALIVLVNLRNVVLRMADKRTNQVVWLSKGIVDYAKRDLKIANVALAFTQTDAYRDVIEAAGGDLKSVLRKYLPDVFNVYSKLPLFALSAVNKTVLGDDGLPRPAPGFRSQGLDDLVHWMLGCTEAGRAYADEIEKMKQRPHVIWRELVAGMEALSADAAQPTGLSAAERLAKVTAVQGMAAELADNGLRHTVPGFADEDLAERRAELENWAKLAGLANEYVKAVAEKRGAFAAQLEASLASEGMAQPLLLARVREETRQIRVAQKRGVMQRVLVAAGLVAAAVVAVVAAKSHNAEVDRLVAEKGYSCTTCLGIKTAVWATGKAHPTSNYLKTSYPEGTWVSTRPGYEWVRGTASDKWTPGLVHPDNADLVADATPETWKCTKRFYRWKRGTTEIEWDVGCAHPTCSDLRAADKPGTWVCTKKGYKWDGKDGVERVLAAGDTIEIELLGGAKMEFVWCPACPQGFWMGSPSSEEERDGDETLHHVKLTQGFWMGKYEVTQAQWESVMGSNPSRFKGANRPVEEVSWDGCQEFIRKINAAGQVTVSLPTEAQWEYACRAGTTTPFNFGSVLNGDKANCDGDYPYGTSTKGRDRNETSDVGSYAPNAWNLHDMHGNVWEWCSDWKGDYAGDAIDPTGPASGSDRVRRGGGWGNHARSCRSAYRSYDNPSNIDCNFGFRLCCSAGPRR